MPPHPVLEDTLLLKIIEQKAGTHIKAAIASPATDIEFR